MLNAASTASLNEEDGITSTANESGTAEALNKEEAKMRRHLKYFFMDPIDKFYAKRTIPWKLIVQIVKLVFVTTQLVLFAFNGAAHVNFTDHNVLAFKHLYLKDWEASYETLPYPPSTGEFAIYTYEEFYDKLDFAVSQYNKTGEIALGSYVYAPISDHTQIQLCKRYYREGRVDPNADTFNYTASIDEACLSIVSSPNFTSQEFLAEKNFTISFQNAIDVSMRFAIETVQLKMLDLDRSPECYRFEIKIAFDNSGHHGQIPVKLTATPRQFSCIGSVTNFEDEKTSFALQISLDVLVVVLCIASAFMCLRSLIHAQLLWRKTHHFFRDKKNMDISSDRCEFINLWFVLIVINDIFIILGSGFKIALDNQEKSYGNAPLLQTLDEYSVCSYMLGIGAFLVWVGVLRYFGFSYKNSILLQTIRRAIPELVRYSGCAAVLYLGFTLCAWAVLGPYHVKFRSFMSTVECLFSLVNGDDMYVTFSIIQGETTVIYWFSRIFLYTFIGLFVFVVLNLGLTIIIEAYEGGVKGLADTFGRRGPLWEFIRECPNDCRSPTFLQDDIEEREVRRQRRLSVTGEYRRTGWLSSGSSTVDEGERDWVERCLTCCFGRKRQRHRTRCQRRQRVVVNGAGVANGMPENETTRHWPPSTETTPLLRS